MMKTIIKSFDTWTAAQTIKSNGRNISVANQRLLGIDKLRELILELAVRGKLVPQDEKDEPASELAKRISKTKKNLIQDGKIKSQAKGIEILKSEMPFGLPENWLWQRIVDIGYTQTGGTPNKNNKDFFGKDIPFIKPGDIYPSYVDYTNEGLSVLGNENLGRTAPKDSLLMVCIGTIGKCNLIERDCAFNQQINSLTPYLINPKYLLAALRSNYFQKSAWQKSSSTTIAILNKSNWESIIIPIPPLAEQHRIVAKVDELMALCDQLEQQQTQSNTAHQQLVELLLQNLTEAGSPEAFEAAWQRIALNFDTLFTTEYSIDHLKQTILQLAVMGKLVPQDPKDEPASELLKKIAREKERLINSKKYQKTGQITPFDLEFELPKNWVGVRIGELCPSIVPNRDKPRTFSGTIPWITLPDFPEDKWILDTKQKKLGLTIQEIEEYSARIIPTGCVLMSCVGRFGLTAINLEPVVVNQQIHAFVMLNGLSPKFLSMVIKVNSQSLDDNANSTTIKYLNKTKCESIQFGLPPLAEQHRIVSKVDELFAICDALKERIKEAQETQGVLAEGVVEGVLG